MDGVREGRSLSGIANSAKTAGGRGRRGPSERHIYVHDSFNYYSSASVRVAPSTGRDEKFNLEPGLPPPVGPPWNNFSVPHVHRRRFPLHRIELKILCSSVYDFNTCV